MDKDNDKFKEQARIVFDEFFKEPLTMKMVSVRCKIDRANICWFNRTFRHTGRITAVYKGICKITKHRATYWTTNPALFPDGSQLNLFDQ